MLGLHNFSGDVLNMLTSYSDVFIEAKASTGPNKQILKQKELKTLKKVIHAFFRKH